MTRSTAAAASTARRGASAFTFQTTSAGRVATMPAAWKTSRAPRNARRNPARSRTSASMGVTLAPPSCASRDGSRCVTLTSAPRSASTLVTWAPTNPVAPVTATRIPGYSYGARSERLLESGRVPADIDLMPHRSRLLTLVLAACLAGPASASAAEFVPGEMIVRHEGQAAEIVPVDPGESVPEAATDMGTAPDVQYAVPNYKAHASVIWDDPGRSG